MPIGLEGRDLALMSKIAFKWLFLLLLISFSINTSPWHSPYPVIKGNFYIKGIERKGKVGIGFLHH